MTKTLTSREIAKARTKAKKNTAIYEDVVPAKKQPTKKEK